MRKALSRLLRNDTPAHISIANGIAYGLTLMTIPVIARSIGPDGRGETAAALAAFAIVPTILGLGLPLELRRRSASGIDADSVRAGRDLVLLSIIPAVGIAFLFIETIYSGVDRQLRLCAFLGLLLTPVSVGWATDAGILTGMGRYRAVFWMRIAQPAVTFVMVWATALIQELTAPAVLVASMLGTVTTGALGLIFCRVGIRGVRAGRPALLRDGARYAGSVIAESASSRLDQVVVLPLIGATAAGYYSIAASIALLPLALGHSLAADHFRAAAASTSASETQAINQRAIRESLAVVVPACLLFAAVAAPSIPVVFGEEFRNSIPAFLILIPGSIALTVGFVASMLLAAQGRGAAMTTLQIAGLAVGMGLLILLGPTLLANGAALASTVSYVLLLIGQLVALRLRVGGILPTTHAFRKGLRGLWRGDAAANGS